MPLRTPRARSYAEIIVADGLALGLIGYWRLGEGGSAFADSSPYGWTLSTTGTGVAPGKAGGLPNDPNRSVGFVGSTADFLQTVGTIPIFPTTSYTVHLWALATAAGSYCCAFSSRPGGANGPFFGVNGGTANAIVVYDNAHVPSESNGVTAVVDSRWHHLAATYDGTNVRTYVDGKLDNTQARTSSGGPSAYQPTFGSEQPASNTGWQGTIQDVAWYTKALSTAQIKAYYDARTNPAYMARIARTLPVAPAGVGLRQARPYTLLVPGRTYQGPAARTLRTQLFDARALPPLFPPVTAVAQALSGVVDSDSSVGAGLSLAVALTAGSAPATGALSTVATSTNAGAYQRPANDKVAVLWDGSLVVADYDGSTGHLYQVTNPSTNPVVTSLQTFTEDNLSLCVLNGGSSSDLWVLSTGDLVGGATAHVRHALYSGGTFAWDASTLVANTIQANSNDCSIAWTGTWLIAMWWDGVGSSSNDQIAYSWTTVKAGTSGWSAAAKFDPAGTSTTIWQVNLRYSAKLAATVAVYGGNSKMHYSILKDSAASPARANWTTMADLDAGFDDTYAQFGGPSVVVDEATGKIHVARAVCNSGGPTWFGVTYWLGTPDATPMVTPSISWSSRLIVDSAGSASSPTDIAAGLDNSGKLWVFWTDAVSAGNLKYATLVSPYTSASSATTFVSTGTPRYPHVPSSVLSYIPLVYQTGTGSPWSVKLDTTLGAQSVPADAPSLAWLSSLSAVLTTGTSVALAGRVTASSTLTATPALTEALAATSFSTASLTATATTIVALSGVVVSASAVAATAVSTVALSGAQSAASTLTASASAAIALSGAESSASTLSATATITLGTALASPIAAASTFRATLATAVVLAGSEASVAVLSASPSLAVVLAGSWASNSAVVGNLQVVSGLQIPGASNSYSTLSATAAVAVALAGSVVSQSAVAATPKQATALSAGLGSASSLGANLQVLSGQQIAGATGSQSSISASLSLSVALSAASISSSVLGGLLSGVTTPLASTSASSTTLGAALSEAVQLTAGLASTSGLAANLQVVSGQQFAAFAASTSVLGGDLKLTVTLAASSGTTSAISATLGLARAIAGSSASQSAVVGNLLAPMLFTGVVASFSTERATLATVYAISGRSSSAFYISAPGIGLSFGLQGLIVLVSTTVMTGWSTGLRDYEVSLENATSIESREPTTSVSSSEPSTSNADTRVDGR